MGTNTPASAMTSSVPVVNGSISEGCSGLTDGSMTSVISSNGRATQLIETSRYHTFFYRLWSSRPAVISRTGWCFPAHVRGSVLALVESHLVHKVRPLSMGSGDGDRRANQKKRAAWLRPVWLRVRLEGELQASLHHAWTAGAARAATNRAGDFPEVAGS